MYLAQQTVKAARLRAADIELLTVVTSSPMGINDLDKRDATDDLVWKNLPMELAVLARLRREYESFGLTLASITREIFGVWLEPIEDIGPATRLPNVSRLRFLNEVSKIARDGDVFVGTLNEYLQGDLYTKTVPQMRPQLGKSVETQLSASFKRVRHALDELREEVPPPQSAA